MAIPRAARRPRRKKGEKRRILDHAKLEVGYDAHQKSRGVREVEARLGRLVDAQAKPRSRAEIERFIRSEGLKPTDLFVYAETLRPAVPAWLHRRRAQLAQEHSGATLGTPSKLEKFTGVLYPWSSRAAVLYPGSSRVVVVPHSVIPRVVEAIYKRHPEIRSWLAELGLTVEAGTSLLYKYSTTPRRVTRSLSNGASLAEAVFSGKRCLPSTRTSLTLSDVSRARTLSTGFGPSQSDSEHRVGGSRGWRPRSKRGSPPSPGPPRQGTGAASLKPRGLRATARLTPSHRTFGSYVSPRSEMRPEGWRRITSVG